MLLINFPEGLRKNDVGLEINEPPILSDSDHSIISDGFVLALDMHMMDEKFGVVKLEDMILIGEKNQSLTKTPRELFEIEQIKKGA